MPQRSDIIKILVSLPFVIYIGYNAYLLISLGLSSPILGIDAVGNFGIKARLWYETGELFPKLLMDPEYIMYKRRYPPVISLMEALWSTFVGWDGYKMKWFFAGCWVAGGILLHGTIIKRTHWVAAWIATTIWFLLPFNFSYFQGAALAGYADTPFAMATVASLLVMTQFHPGRNTRYILLTAILLSGTFWIKREGMIVFMSAIPYLRYRKISYRNLLIIVSISAFLWLVSWSTTRGIPHFLEQDISLDISLKELVRRLTSYPGLIIEELGKSKHWGEYLWRLFLIGWIVKVITCKPRRWLSPELYFLVFLFSTYSIILIFTIWDFARNTNFAFHRLFIHIFPLLILATFLNIPDLNEKKADDVNQ